ncbi:MAG: DUF502 domain-containing protein [Haloarculaceae archaeon]
MTLLSATAPPGAGTNSGPSVRTRLRSILITGVALTVPVIVTLIILQFVVNVILGAVSPVASFVTRTFGLADDVDPLVLELLAVATFLALVFVVGLVAELRQGDELERVFDTAMARIPGVGSVYTSFNEMTEMLLSNETQSFQEVKLVEFPVEGSYTLAFVTAESPPEIERATDYGDMRTLFLPMAPNPVMGGYVLHVSDERVYDVDPGAIREQALEEVEDFTMQARRDLASVRPEGDPQEVGEEGADSPTHYRDEQDTPDTSEPDGTGGSGADDGEGEV